LCSVELGQRYTRQRRFKNALKSELKRREFDPEKFETISRQNRAPYFREIEKRLRKRSPQAKAGRPHAVWGQTSGVEVPAYDFDWTYNDTLNGVARASDFVASKSTGFLQAAGLCGQGRFAEMEDSAAGVGFWYIPDRFGFLFISMAPSLETIFEDGAGWDDVGAAGGWITLGIQRYRRQPFVYEGWVANRTDQLWWDVETWYDDESQYRNRTAYPMSTLAVLDVDHFYACWAVIHAYAYGRNGGGYGHTFMKAIVPSFTFAFF